MPVEQVKNTTHGTGGQIITNNSSTPIKYLVGAEKKLGLT
jgi:hypothetical protein